MSVLVKGSNRQVIVVRSPDPRLFDEAIFLLRQDAPGRDDPEEFLRQARQAADGYVRTDVPPVRRGLPGPLIFLLGAGLASALWWAWPLVF